MNNNEDSIIRRSEIEANYFVAKTMRVTAILMTGILALNLAGIFIIAMGPMIATYVASVVLLLIPTVLVNIMKMDMPWLKYLFVVISIIFVSILTITLNWQFYKRISAIVE